jgi:hypothetical protein
VQSRRTAVVRSQAEGRNTVIWIIDEGRTVSNGQLLVELDASTLSDRRTDQQILVGNAESALIDLPPPNPYPSGPDAGTSPRKTRFNVGRIKLLETRT